MRDGWIGPFVLISLAIAACVVAAALRVGPLFAGAALALLAGLLWNGRFPADRNW